MDQSQGGNPFGRLIEFARPHKTGYIVSVVLAVLGVAFGIVPYFATARMTIELLSGNRDLSFYMVWCLISGGCFVLKAILMGISTRASHEATFEVLSEARRKIASKLTRVPMGYILNTPSGQLKNGMVERIEQLEVPLAHVIPEMTSNLLVPIAIIVYLFVLDWRMALVSLITIPVGMMCYMGMMKEYPKKYGEVVKAGNHMSATTVEYIGGIEVIKAFNQADNSYQKFTDAVHANADLILDWMKDTQKYSAIMMSVWPAALISVLPVGCLFYMNGSLSAATFITVTVLSLGIAGPLVAAMFFTDDIAKIGTVMGEIDGILNQPELVRPERKCDLQNLDIALENVHFAYEEKEVLKGIDLTIPQGKITAFVGPSGSGKSTIAKLIASFWDVTGGLITIGDKSVKEISNDQLNDLISYVSQDNYLFNDTVRNNIRIGTIIISLLAQFGTRWFPSAMMGYYLLSTTKVSEFVLAMQRMHIPEAFIIPFSVMFRFFPTISEEAGSIGNAMRMRGITGKNFFKNPQAVLEYRIVPLMMSVVTIGNDLSAAALTRGLGNGKKRTSICKIGFHWKDFALMIIVTAALLVFLLF